jgi:hypothetical protein
MTEPQDMRGLPDAADARQDALIRLRATLDTAVQQARDEALDDLGLCLKSAINQGKALQQFDSALIDLLTETDRDDARRFLRSRDAASLWAGSVDKSVPF